MKKDWLGFSLLVGFILACLLGACAIEYAKWSECTRVHPVWYCLLK